MRGKPEARAVFAFQLKMAQGWDNPPTHHSVSAKRLSKKQHKVRSMPALPGAPCVLTQQKAKISSALVQVAILSVAQTRKINKN